MKLAEASVERSDKDAVAAEEIGRIAERAAKHAERTARIAREAANRAATFAQENRSGYLAEAQEAVTTSRAEQAAARDRYHDAEREVRERQ